MRLLLEDYRQREEARLKEPINAMRRAIKADERTGERDFAEAAQLTVIDCLRYVLKVASHWHMLLIFFVLMSLGSVVYFSMTTIIGPVIGILMGCPGCGTVYLPDGSVCASCDPGPSIFDRDYLGKDSSIPFYINSMSYGLYEVRHWCVVGECPFEGLPQTGFIDTNCIGNPSPTCAGYGIITTMTETAAVCGPLYGPGEAFVAWMRLITGQTSCAQSSNTVNRAIIGWAQTPGCVSGASFEYCTIVAGFYGVVVFAIYMLLAIIFIEVFHHVPVLIWEGIHEFIDAGALEAEKELVTVRTRPRLKALEHFVDV